MLETGKNLFLGAAGIRGSVKKYIDNNVRLIQWVNSLPETGDNRYLYAVIMPEETRDGYPIVQLFLWDNAWFAQKAYPIGVDPNNILLKTAITVDANNVVTIDLG